MACAPASRNSIRPIAAIIGCSSEDLRSGWKTSRSARMASDGDGDAGADHREPVVQAKPRHQIERDEGADHVQRAVREIRHRENAVDQRQTERDEAINTAQSQPVEDLLQKHIHVFKPSNQAPGASTAWLQGMRRRKPDLRTGQQPLIEPEDSCRQLIRHSNASCSTRSGVDFEHARYSLAKGIWHGRSLFVNRVLRAHVLHCRLLGKLLRRFAAPVDRLDTNDANAIKVLLSGSVIHFQPD